MVDAPTMDDVREFFQRPAVSHWLSYLIKAAVLLVAVGLLSYLLPIMPSVFVGITWGALSVLASLGIAYPLVMRKTLKQVELREDRFLSRLNNGRMLRLAISFVVAATLMAGLLFELPRWSPTVIGIVVCSAPLYMLVSIAVEKYMATQYTPLFQTKGVVLTSGVLTSLLMLIIYAVLVGCFKLDISDMSLGETYLSTSPAFPDSPSAILRELDWATTAENVATDSLVNQSYPVSPVVAVIVRLVLCAGTFFGISSLLNLCALNKREILRIFQPLEAINADDKADRSVLKRYVAWLVVLPIVFTACFVYADTEVVNKIANIEIYSDFKETAQDALDKSITEIDGEYYDTAKVDELRDSASRESDSLAEEARRNLKAPINRSFQHRIKNVDNGHDIEEGIDDTDLLNSFKEYADKAKALEQQTIADLQNCRIDTTAADKRSDISPRIDDTFLSDTLSSSQKIAEAYDGLMGGAGQETDPKAIANRVADRAPATDTSEDQGFFSKAMAFLNSILGNPEPKDTAYIEDVRNELLSAIGENNPDA